MSEGPSLGVFRADILGVSSAAKFVSTFRASVLVFEAVAASGRVRSSMGDIASPRSRSSASDVASSDCAFGFCCSCCGSLIKEAGVAGERPLLDFAKSVVEDFLDSARIEGDWNAEPGFGGGPIIDSESGSGDIESVPELP